MNERRLWLVNCLVSLVLGAALITQWAMMDQYGEQRDQRLIDAATAEAYIEQNWDRKRRLEAPDARPALRIRTGIFIQSLKFLNSSDVNLTGYIWQHYRANIDDDIVPATGEVGFVLPDRVDSNVADVEAYRRKTPDGQVIGWYFEATIRQPFDYSAYPFDHKTVWVRLWQKHAANIVLIPDYESYEATGVDDIFGIEQSIVLNGWRREDTYFNYRSYDYDTNFGIPDYVGQYGFPELHYNFVIQRRFENAFIVHLLPLFLVAALLFGMLLTVSDDDDLAHRHGFSTGAMIGACSALFFVVLLAHIHLRKDFSAGGIVYLEYFYVVMYCALASSAAYSYLLTQRALTVFPLNRLRNPLTVKLAFWPALLGTMIVITAIVQLA